MEKVKQLVKRYLLGFITAEEFWREMNQLDRAGDIDDNDWAYASNIVP